MLDAVKNVFPASPQHLLLMSESQRRPKDHSHIPVTEAKESQPREQLVKLSGN